MTPAPNSLIKISVVTPVFNRRELTLQCIRSLKRLNLRGLDLNVIVVDDGSSDGTSEALRAQFPDVEVIKGDGNLWFSEGTNVGIRRAIEHGADYVWQINNDQVFDEDALRSMIDTAEANGKAVVGSLLLLWDAPHRVFQVAPVWDTLAGGWKHWVKQTIWSVPEGPFEVELIVGNSMLVPADAYREVGFLDSARFPLYGDAEFAVRLRRANYRLIVDPSSRVFCEPNTPPASLSTLGIRLAVKQLLGDGRNRHSLRARLQMLVSTAPSKMRGVAAFAVFLTRAFLGKSYETSWAAGQPERELKELYKPIHPEG